MSSNRGCTGGVAKGINGRDGFIEIGPSFQEVVKLRLMRFGTSTADIFDDATLQVIKLLICDEIPNLNASLLVMRGVVFRALWASA
jgi:hypothetical protein